MKTTCVVNTAFDVELRGARLFPGSNESSSSCLRPPDQENAAAVASRFWRAAGREDVRGNYGP